MASKREFMEIWLAKDYIEIWPPKGFYIEIWNAKGNIWLAEGYYIEL